MIFGIGLALKLKSVSASNSQAIGLAPGEGGVRFLEEQDVVVLQVAGLAVDCPLDVGWFEPAGATLRRVTPSSAAMTCVSIDFRAPDRL